MTKSLKTSLIGKINNLPQFKREALLPVFEAVANSIQAIEENQAIDGGKIVVKIHRDDQLLIDGVEQEGGKIVGFTIIDDGIGFDDVNYDSFLTSDTTHKLEKGCKGVGRFFWLKAFEKVEIESIYDTIEDKRKKRLVSFDLRNGIEEIQNIPTNEERRTSINLIGFKEEYRTQQSAYKTTGKIAQRILEHCLSYYINENSPLIIVQDEDENISLNQLFEGIRKHIVTDVLDVFGEKFKISHLKLYSTYNKMHNVVFCANTREVKSFNISKLLNTSAQFDEADEKFIYSAYVSGDYLDQHVNPSRIEFDIPESQMELLSGDCSVSMEQIKIAVVESTKEFLLEYLENLKDRRKEIVRKYVETHNPTLRAVLEYCPEVYEEVDPATSDERINEVLYKYKGKAEFEIRRQSAKLLKTQPKSIEEVREKYKEIGEKIESFQKDDLASYILHRKMIIDLLEKKLEIKENGKYFNEDVMHDIIFPRKATTDRISFEDHNMWLVDERLTFHSFATSDNRFCDSTTSDSKERPDILVFSEVDNQKIARAVSVMELKKPQRKNLDEDPTKQIFRYVRNIRSNSVVMPNGREIFVDDATRYYCYVICDLTTSIREYAENNNFTQLRGELGYYSYNRKLNAHTEIIAFDKIITDAKQRHKAFFEKLGI